MLVPNRHGTSPLFKHRYGYQGQEKDDEIKGEGNSLNYTFRMHDPRLGRFFAIDPLAPEYPWNSPYAFSENRVIASIELEGLEAFDLSGATPEFGPQPENSNATVYGPYTEEGAYNAYTMGTFQLNEVAIEGNVTPREVDGRQVILESARLLGGSEKFDNAVINTYNETLNQPAGVRWQCIAGTALMAEKMETGGWLGSSISWGGGSVAAEVSSAAKAAKLPKINFARFFRRGLPKETVGAARRGFSDGAKWPLKILDFKKMLSASCDADALKIRNAIGGDIMTITNKRKGLWLGSVKYGKETLTWSYHKAVIKNGRVYDRLTGEGGLPLEEYKTLFEWADDLLFQW